jgi:hypothetical protein
VVAMQQQQQMQGGGGGVPSAALQQQALVARPPRMLSKQRVVCRSCEVLSPVEFLEHLKELGWYQDQVCMIGVCVWGGGGVRRGGGS